MAPNRRPLVIAHRGASRDRPENTLSAYELAIAQDADMIEVDLHRTRDGEVVIHHDEGLGRLGGRGEIADASAADVRELDAGQGEVVPILDEMLDRFGKRIPFNLELKQSTRGPYAGLEQIAWDAVVERGISGQTLFSSFYDPVLEELRRVAPAARIALLLSRRSLSGWEARAAALGAEAVNPERTLATPEFIARAHGEGLAVYVYTVDDPAEMQRLIEAGVDGIFTNVPEVLRGLLPAAG